MEQVGKENPLGIREGDGLIAAGGSPDDRLRIREAVVFGESLLKSESLGLTERVVITNA